MKQSELTPTLGPYVADFIEKSCIHGPGEIMGRPAILTDDHLRFLYRLFELRPDGSRKFRRACYSRAKGSSKTELAAWIALVEAFGPARCAGFDSDGKPIPAPAVSPDIMCLATEEGQAGLAYSVIHLNINEGPLKSLGADSGLTRTLLPGGGVIRAGSAGAASKDGLRPTLLVADETHRMLGRELADLHAVLWRGIFKRPNALLLETTTSYRPGEGSIAQKAMETYANMKPDDADRIGVLYDHRGATCTFEQLDDPVIRMAALMEAYGSAASYMPLEELVGVYDLADTDKIEWARYWANMVVASADSWVDAADWAKLADPTLSLHDGDVISLGGDFSLIDDASAVVACRLSDGFVTPIKVWQKPEGRVGQGWQVPFDDVKATIRSVFERFKVTRFYADPTFVASLLDDLVLEYGEGRVFRWATNRPIAMGAALQRAYVAIATGDGLKHDGDATLTRHVLNSRTWMSSGRTLIRKDSHRSVNKIDAAIAMVLAVEASADAHTAGEDIEPAAALRRVWSF